MEVISTGSDRFRVGSWRGDTGIGYLMPLTRIGPGAIDQAIRELYHRGFRQIVTGALSHDEQGPFLRQGFVVHERLHLLRHDLDELAFPHSPANIRRGRKRDRDPAIAVDKLAFDDFWRFDEPSFLEAMNATPTSRFRVATDRRWPSLAGYAIAGRAGRTGYLQRLAVHPQAQGHGIGTALVHDTLTWLARRGSVSVMVNTQEKNQGAFDLYRRLGFQALSPGLAVMELTL